MEKKINIVELLKDCPKGMELDCTMFDDVKFIEIEDDDDGFNIDKITHWQPIVLPKKEEL